MRYTAATIAEMLAQRAEDVCQRLLPSGKRVGAEWAAGDIHGGAGGSLKVRLTGAKAGVWCDFADEGAKGDLLDLWRLSQNVTTGEAISQAKAWMGVSEPRSSDIKPIYDRNRPAPQTEGIKRLSEGSPVFRYLTEERFIEPDTLTAYRIGEFQRNGDPAIVFPIFDPVKAAGKATALKYLALGRKPDGKKITWSSKGSVWHAFGWSAIPESSRLIVLTEGEIDAMTIHSWGVPAISIPQGAENDGWIGEDFDHLERFDEIYLCLDNDEAGLKATERLSKRLGRERCRIIRLGYKDANSAAQEGFAAEHFHEAMQSAKSMDPPELSSPLRFADEVEEDIHPASGEPPGTESFLGHNFPLRVRPNELTIWTGFSGHGKSPAILQGIISDMSKGERGLVVSLELQPKKILAMMSKQAMGRFPAKGEAVKALTWMEGKCWVIDKVGTYPWRDLLVVMEYAVARYGITRIIIDSLLLLGISSDDYEQQKECVAALVSFAGRTGAHVHLVAHSKKLDNEEKPPSKFDVKGSGDITDLCHNGITVWRHMKKERELRDSGLSEERRMEIQNKYPDVIFTVWKQRETGELPRANAWINKSSYQALADAEQWPMCYMGMAERTKRFDETTEKATIA